MKHLLVIHTGGTISMSQDQSNKVVTNDINPISMHQDVINQYAQIDELNPFNVPSPHMTIQHVKQLKDIILEAVTNKYYDGFVITHGTDTLEETAFLLDLILGIEQPVVITGAMRSSNEIGSDGLYNYISAIRVASVMKRPVIKASWLYLMMKFIRRVMLPKHIRLIQTHFKVQIMVR